MKNKLFLFVITIFFSVVNYAQTKISGKVGNFHKKQIVLKGYNFKKNIKFDVENKTFSENIENLKTGNYSLVFKRYVLPVYIEKGKDFHVEFDIRYRENPPVFSGENQKINEYLSKKKDLFWNVLGSANRLFRLDEEQFLNDMKTYKRSLEKLLEESNLPKVYSKYEKRNIFYAYARNIHNYKSYHKILSRDETFEVSGNYPNYIEKIDFNKEKDYLFSLDYRMMVKDYFFELETEKANPKEDYYLTYIDDICKKIKNQTIKNDLLFEVAQKGLVETENTEEFYQKFEKNSTNKTNNKVITDLYDSFKKIYPGMPSPKFKDYTNYEGGKTSLDDLLGKGKYTYILIWATWCSYCKKEIAKLNELEDKINYDKVQFVGINVDKANKFRKWKVMVKYKDMKGIQLFSGKPHTELDFAKKYLVEGVPRVILLDPEGKIVSANAPRPARDNENFIKFMKKYGLMK